MEDGGDLDFSGDLPAGCSMDSFFDEILKADGAACTHTHTCNPPVGPDPSQHTHTCFHVHTKILPPSAADDDTADSNSGAYENHRPSSKKRSFGNREAVRKYREKKKARAASLEDEVLQLRTLNQQLMRRLQSQAALEAEVARLRCLLVDIRGRIEGEIGSFPYQKPPVVLPGNMVLDSCENLRCDGSGGGGGGNPVYCVGPGGMGEIGVGNGQGCGGGGCEIGNSVQCLGSSSTGSKEFYICGGNADVGNIKGVHAAPKG